MANVVGGDIKSCDWLVVLGRCGMDIFNNDSEVLQIGALTIENHTDCVVIVGDVQIDKTATGRQQAQALYQFAKQLVDTLEQCQDDTDDLVQPKPSKTLPNPFA